MGSPRSVHPCCYTVAPADAEPEFECEVITDIKSPLGSVGVTHSFDSNGCKVIELEASEALTVLSLDEETGALSYKDEDCVTKSWDLKTFVRSCIPAAEEICIVDENGISYEQSANGCFIIPEPPEPEVTDLIFTDGDGVDQNSADSWVIPMIVDAAGNSLAMDGNGNWVLPAATAHTPSSMTNVGGGVYEHDDGEGNVVSFDICAEINANCAATAVANADGSYTVTGNDGVAITIPAAPDAPCIVDSTGAPLQVDANGCFVLPAAAAGGSTSAMTNVGGGVYEHDDGAGNVVPLDICSEVNANCPATAVANADGSHTITGTDGNTIIIPAPADPVCIVDSAGAALSVNASGCFVLPASAAGGSTSSMSNLGGGVYEHDNGAGSVVSFDICAEVNANCPASAVANPDGSFTVTGTDGSAINIPAATCIVDSAGAALAVDANGCFVLPASAAGGSTSSMANLGGGVYEHDNGAGSVVALDICAEVNANCPATAVANADGSFTVTGTDGSVINIPAAVAGGATSSVTDNADGSYTHTDGAGVSQDIVTATVTDNADGTGTVTDGQGNTCVFAGQKLVNCDLTNFAKGQEVGVFDTISAPDAVTTYVVPDETHLVPLAKNAAGCPVLPEFPCSDVLTDIQSAGQLNADPLTINDISHVIEYTNTSCYDMRILAFHDFGIWQQLNEWHDLVTPFNINSRVTRDFTVTPTPQANGPISGAATNLWLSHNDPSPYSNDPGNPQYLGLIGIDQQSVNVPFIVDLPVGATATFNVDFAHVHNGTIPPPEQQVIWFQWSGWILVATTPSPGK